MLPITPKCNDAKAAKISNSRAFELSNLKYPNIKIRI